MLYLFTGTNEHKARTTAFAWVAAARKKEPGAAYVRLGAEDITERSLEEAVQSQGLFFSKMLVLLDDPFSTIGTADIVLEALPQLAQSANPIAILAPNLLASRAKKIEAKAEKVFTHDLAAKRPSRGFNSSLVNSLGAKDGTGLWKEIVKAKREDDAPEMLHGLLHWKARDLMKKGSRAWSEQEARELSVRLIELLSDSRSGDLQLADALERFALTL